jgi:predicted ATPase
MESLRAALRTREVLIVLDNCEHVIDEAAVVAEALLQTCLRVSIMATSRERLNVGGERVYRLPSLSVPPLGSDLSVEELLSFGACALFVERARAADHTFEVRVDSQAHIADICRQLDGIPLAIELAAARIRVLSPAQIAIRLTERFRLLTGGSRTALPRQQTMRATIDWSHELLTERERTLLRRVSVFAGGWTLDAASIVCATPPLDLHDVVDTLDSLVEKSLVVAESSTTARRYRLLESTRAYALEKLEASDERDTCAREHAQWIAGLAIGFRKSYHSVPREHWLRQLGPEVDNIRAALNYTLESKTDEELARRILWLARVSDGLTLNKM